MSYLIDLVKSAKSTDGYTGRQGAKYANLEESLQSDSQPTQTGDNSNKWVMYAGIGVGTLVGGILLYRKFIRSSSDDGRNPDPHQPNTSNTRKSVDPELQELRERNTELQRESSNQKRTDWERFKDKVPEDMVSDKDQIFGGK